MPSRAGRSTGYRAAPQSGSAGGFGANAPGFLPCPLEVPPSIYLMDVAAAARSSGRNS
jgi:hypothetical protein